MKKDSTQGPGIPGMNLENKYSKEKPIMPENTEKLQKEMEKTKKELDKLKSWIVKKYPFTQSLSILPPQAINLFIEEEEVPKETEKYIHLYMIIPEEKYTEKSKTKEGEKRHLDEMKKEIVKEIEKIKGQKIWLQIKSPVDVWENCLDSKFNLASAIAMSFPLHDTGFLGALRVAEIHKSLIVRKFERYVVSYVLGGSLVRGDAVATSDVDVFVIIDDTDVKKMSRLELKERLREWIYKYVSEAMAVAGVKNPLSPQVYLLTDFWESVKDAHPVMFTFIRDGVPTYDKGTFMPWKALLRMGKLKPSPEAIDMFMSMGDGVITRSKRTLLSDIFTNIFWGVTTPAQAIVMLNGNPPPNAKKELVPEFKKLFFDTGMIEKKYIDFLERVVNIWKDYEHEKINEISGKEIDKLLIDTADYLKRLKELRKQIEKKYQERTIEQVYKDVFGLLKNIVGEQSQDDTLKTFEKNYVKTGKFTNQHLRMIREMIEVRAEFKKGKASLKKIDEVRRDSTMLMGALMEYTQRCDLVSLDRSRMVLKYKDGIAEMLNANGLTFLIRGNDVHKITNKIENSTMSELTDCVEKQRSQKNIVIQPKVFDLLKKELGDFEIVL